MAMRPEHHPGSPAPVGSSAVYAEGPNLAVKEDMEAALVCLMATGAGMGEALATLVDLWGEPPVRERFLAYLDAGRPGNEILADLDHLAERRPSLANACLHDGLAHGRIHAWGDVGVKGLHLLDRPWITSLPDGLKVDGRLVIPRSGITELPKGLEVKGGIYLNECASLARLPQGLVVPEWEHFDFGGSGGMGVTPMGTTLSLTRCTALVSLPPDIQALGSLDLSDCTALTSMPTGMRVGNDLTLDACESLERLPGGIVVGHVLSMTDCANLKSLADSLEVGRTLVLLGCRSLTSLPRGLSVGGSLELRGCSSWDGFIPVDARIAGLIHTDAFPGGMDLESWRRANPNGEGRHRGKA